MNSGTSFFMCLAIIIAYMISHMPHTYILYVKTNNSTLADYYQNWKYHYEGDSGVDLVLQNDIMFKDHGRLDFGISAVMTKNGNPTSYYLYGRSSLSKLNLYLTNPVGVMDAGYTGNLFTYAYSEDKIVIPAMSRLVQICAPDLTPISKIHVVKSLPVLGSRGEKGFGSTGK